SHHGDGSPDQDQAFPEIPGQTDGWNVRIVRSLRMGHGYLLYRLASKDVMHGVTALGTSAFYWLPLPSAAYGPGPVASGRRRTAWQSRRHGRQKSLSGWVQASARHGTERTVRRS